MLLKVEVNFSGCRVTAVTMTSFGCIEPRLLYSTDITNIPEGRGTGFESGRSQLYFFWYAGHTQVNNIRRMDELREGRIASATKTKCVSWGDMALRRVAADDNWIGPIGRP